MRVTDTRFSSHQPDLDRLRFFHPSPSTVDFLVIFSATGESRICNSRTAPYLARTRDVLEKNKVKIKSPQIGSRLVVRRLGISQWSSSKTLLRVFPSKGRVSAASVNGSESSKDCQPQISHEDSNPGPVRAPPRPSGYKSWPRPAYRCCQEVPCYLNRLEASISMSNTSSALSAPSFQDRPLDKRVSHACFPTPSPTSDDLSVSESATKACDSAVGDTVTAVSQLAFCCGRILILHSSAPIGRVGRLSA